MSIILKRNHETLKTVLGNWIKKDSIIYIDEWKIYKNVCEVLEILEYKSANHKEWFLCPDTDVHTQNPKF